MGAFRHSQRRPYRDDLGQGRITPMAAKTAPAPRHQRDAVRGDHYFKLSENRVAHSVELSDLVVADYDETGAVRGIEFVGKRTEPSEYYLEKARKSQSRTTAPVAQDSQLRRYTATCSSPR